MTAINTSDLTAASVDGNGTFDVLMRAVKRHLDDEFKKGAIKGAEYAEVYLGSVNLAMQTGLSFLIQKEKIGLEAALLEQQLLLAQLEVQKATIALAMLTASQAKVPAEIAQIQAQTALLTKQVEIADAEIDIKQQQVLVAQAEVEIAEAKLVNIPKEGAQLDAQTLLVGQQRTNAISDNLGTLLKNDVLTQQLAMEVKRNYVHPSDPKLSGNFDQERQVLAGQACKLQAEFDLIQSSTLKSAGEIDLLAQKTATEKAQILATGVDDNSVVGRQKLLYSAQTAGFARDAEQKAAKALIDTWSVRRTTDEATVADATNKLNDATIGRAVDKLLTGIGA